MHVFLHIHLNKCMHIRLSIWVCATNLCRINAYTFASHKCVPVMVCVTKTHTCFYVCMHMIHTCADLYYMHACVQVYVYSRNVCRGVKLVTYVLSIFGCVQMHIHTHALSRCRCHYCSVVLKHALSPTTSLNLTPHLSLPQSRAPSRHERRKVSVESISFLICDSSFCVYASEGCEAQGINILLKQTKNLFYWHKLVVDIGT